jgi:hypothetical protein
MSLDRFLYRLIRKGELTFLTMVGKTVTMADVSMKILQYDADGNVMLCTGLTMPVDGHSGFAKGCIFIDTNVATGTTGRYDNVGTVLSCNFDAIGTISGEVVATANVADDAITLAKLVNITRGSLIVGGVAAAPTELSGKTAGKVLCGDGTDIVSVTMSGDATISAAGVVSLSETMVKYAEVAITSANITDTAAGKLGHADGVVLVADPGATKVVELLSAVLIYDFGGAGYGDGGNITINTNGGAAITGLVSAGNSLGAGADKIYGFVPLATAARAMTANKGLNLVASAAFTNGGSATGVVRIKVAYRVHTHGLA